MASAPPLPAGFEQVPLASSSPAPVTTNAQAARTTPSGMDAEVYRSTLDHLVNTGATRDQISAFIRSAGFPEEHVRGVDASLAYRDDPRYRDAKGNAPRIQVLPIHDTVPSIQHAAPAEAQNQPAIEALPEGFEEVPMDQIAPIARDDAPKSALGEMGLGVRHMLEGAAAIPDTLIGLGALVNGHEQKLTVTKGVDALLDAVGVPNDGSDSDRLAGKMVAGATGGALTGGEMAAVPLLAAAIGGAGAGGGSELARQSGYGPSGQLVAGLAGGLAGGSALAGAGKLAGVFSGARTPNEYLQAAQKAGVADEILPADAGAPLTRSLSSGVLQAPFGRGSIIQQAQRLNDKAQAVVANAAEQFSGAPVNGETLGDTIRAGLESAIKTSRTLPQTAYKRAAALAGDTTVDLSLARATVDDQIARLEATAQTGSIPGQLADLRNLRKELERPLTVQGVRDMRTELRVAPEHRGTPLDARMQAVVEAAGQDAIDSLIAQGKEEAAQAFAQGDKLWSQRLNMIDQVITPLLGRKNAPRSSEAIVKSVNAAMQGNASRFGSFIHALPEEERAVVRSSLISGLGKDKDGVFSISRFADNWRDIQPTAKSALFGKESTEALNALEVIGRQSKFAMRSNNHSNTGGALEAGRLFTYITALPSLGASVGSQVLAGKLLANPRFARWLASVPNKPNPAAQLAHIKQLPKIAAANPVIANDVLALQEHLMQTYNTKPAR